MADLAPQRRPPTRKDLRIDQLDRLCTSLRADLKKQQAVVEAARVVCSNRLDVRLVGEICKALAALDAPPEGEE